VNDQEKLRILLGHWIEHNEEHADEFRRWADKAGAAAPDVLTAAERMGQVNQALAEALKKLGGAMEHNQAGAHPHSHTHEHRHADGTVHTHDHADP
jgi:hypothetical protein